MTLPAAPTRLLAADGQPLFGRYAGQVGDIDWSQLAKPFARSALWRRFHHKRWHYVALCTEQVFAAVAIVDLGWISSVFAYAFDRSDEDMLANFSQEGLPLLSARLANHAGASSSFKGRNCRIAVDANGDGSYQLSLHSDYLEIEASFGPSPSPLLLASGPIARGSVHATQKSSAMPLRGALRTWREDYQLDGGIASFDYSNGLLAHRTDWRWASAHSMELGFNLQAGYFGGHENALWLDGDLIALAPAHFLYDRKDPLSQWHIFTEDDMLDLIFTPEGARRDNKKMLVAASRYLQPVGTFSGWVRAAPDQPKRMVTRLMGVTEDHASRW